MRRRNFIAGLGSAAAWPVVAGAQQVERVRRIGVLMAAEEDDPLRKSWLSAFIQGLSELGWTDGRNVRIDVRWAGENVDRMRMFAKELVDLKPDVFFAHSTPVTAAVRDHAHTIPIVFVNVADPVASGFVAKINQPGGNLTGFSHFESAVVGKLLQFLSEIAPGLERAAIMFNPNTTPASVYVPPFETTARSLKVVPIIAPVHSDVEIETTIAALGREPRGGLVVMPDTFMNEHRVPIISAAARDSVPTVYWLSAFARDGGLLS
jgi:putative tryptophan/tyrosine transport system substrate-binding protein